jgi:hypothetical protein
LTTIFHDFQPVGKLIAATVPAERADDALLGRSVAIP